MTDEIAAEADRIFEEALERTGARDPRQFYRERLLTLKGSDADGYATAVDYYRETLVPDIASGNAEPLGAWTEYGRILAEAVADGRTVSVDSTGLARPYEGPNVEHLILHLPSDGGRGLVVALPEKLSAAQRATYDVLVDGRKKAAS
ncbi:MAG: hypothetical protein HKN72_07340 [Gemmatimonadetes bacterium]|nr:hypothetical protein [Gemmatimonadota bacterium]NNL29454.1 hypothetical protein [Gemmatimonadota bacterium]